MRTPPDSPRLTRHADHDPALTCRPALGYGLCEVLEMAPAREAAWPEPYLQPDRTQDCGFYTTAYIVRCLGNPEVTADEIRAWREVTHYHETAYPRDVTGVQTRTFASLDVTATERAEYYMGPGREAWVRRWLDGGWIGWATVYRIPGMAHAVAVLDADDEGVLLMDPLSGHVTEPWDWFLGIGPGKYGCHYIESWYRT